MAITVDARDASIATTSEEDSVLAVLTLAFTADPGIRWYFPTPSQFLTYFPAFASAYGGKAFDHETAYYVGEYVGAALWVPPGVEPEIAEIEDVMQTALSAQKLALVGEFIERVEQSHPDEPFWELTVLGVDPDLQQNGYGTTLMEPVLAECDREGTPAFLISSNVQNLSFYLRHGFEIVDTIQLPTMPPFFPMRREPQG